MDRRHDLISTVGGVAASFALHHYYLDQKIWRVSRDAGLNKDLKLGTASA